MAVSVGENLEIGDRIVDVLKGRRDTNVLAIGLPEGPLGRGGGGAGRNDAVGDICECSAEMPHEIISDGRWQRCQGDGCG